MSRHAAREARRESIPTEMIALAYDDPDSVRESAHAEDREIRTRWFGDHGVSVVIDRLDARVVTVWRVGWKP
jgi:hypothetical protein